MQDLGYIPPAPKPSLGATPVTIVSEQDAERKPQYPSFRLNGEQAETAGLNKCAIGETYEITIQIRARRLGGDSWEMGSSDKPPAEFDVISADPPTEIEDGEVAAPEKTKAEAPTVKPAKGRILKPPMDEDDE